MKRSTVLVLTGVMTMFLGACGDNSKPSLPTPTPTTAITSPENNKGDTDTTEQAAPGADVRADAGMGASVGSPDIGATDGDAPAEEGDAPASDEMPSA